MPVVRITWFSGRTQKQKAELAKALTESIVKIGKTKAEDVWIIFEDIGKENWAFAGKMAE